MPLVDARKLGTVEIRLVTKSEPEDGRAGAHGATRRLLRLLVQVDSSRFVGKRFGAAVGLVALLAAFGAAGYWLPAFLSYLGR